MTDERLDRQQIEAFAHARAAVLARIDAAAGRAGRDPAGVDPRRRVQDGPGRAAPCRGRGGLRRAGREPGPGGRRQGLPSFPGHAGTSSVRSSRTRRAGLSSCSTSSSPLTRSSSPGGSTGSRASSGRGRPLPVLLQVNVAGRPREGGLRPRRGRRPPCPRWLGLPNLAAPGADDDRPAGRDAGGGASDLPGPARAAPTSSVSGHPGLGPELSMGMSRRLRGRGRGRGDDRPGRPGDLRRAAGGAPAPAASPGAGRVTLLALRGAAARGPVRGPPDAAGRGRPRRRGRRRRRCGSASQPRPSTVPRTRRCCGCSPTSSGCRGGPCASSPAPAAAAKLVAVDGVDAGARPGALAGDRL